MSTVLITGARGFVGRHLLARIDEWDAVTPTSAELDVRDRDAVIAAARAVRPQAIVHLAYRTNERDTIVEGSRNAALAAAETGARLVHASTDVVFGGRPRPYTEGDALDPLHAYGAAKAAAEAEVATTCPSAVMVRLSLVYGTDHPATIQCDVVDAIAGRSQMRFFTDEFRTPIHADDVAVGVVALMGRLSEVSGPLHLSGPATVSRAELARSFAAHLGLHPAAVPTASAVELGLADRRPLNVALDSSLARSLGLSAKAPADWLRPPTS